MTPINAVLLHRSTFITAQTWILLYPTVQILVESRLDTIVSIKGKEAQKRYHIYFGDKRTTIKLDSLLADFLAIKPGCKPDDAQAHSVV